MIKLFFKHFIVNKYTITLLIFFYFYYYVLLFIPEMDFIYVLLIFFVINYCFNFIFIIPSLYITLINKNSFNHTYKQLTQKYNKSFNFVVKYYILSTFVLALMFFFPIIIYELYLLKPPYTTCTNFLISISPFLINLISILLFYTCLFINFTISEPNKNPYNDIVASNIYISPIFAFIQERFLSTIDNYFLKNNFLNDYSSIIAKIYIIFLSLFFYWLSYYIYKNNIINNFKKFIDHNITSN